MDIIFGELTRRWAKEEVCEQTFGERCLGRHLRKGKLLELFLYFLRDESVTGSSAAQNLMRNSK
jgi:hypothetical protein